jgi:ABC-type transport system involved in cytochrome bd biosynthesis fused ATPase/permease subunit
MVKTLAINDIVSDIKRKLQDSILGKIIANPVLLAILIVFIFIIISNIVKSYRHNLFVNVMFNVLIISGLLFCHHNIIKNKYNKEGKQEMSNYFSGMAEKSISNINNSNRMNYDNIRGGLDNLDIDEFLN